MADKKILVTGAAGFIGFHVAQRLASAGQEVVGLDIVNDYYDPTLKEARLRVLETLPSFRFVRMDVADRQAMSSFFSSSHFSHVVHLAAQAGVRYSLENPHAYLDANLAGFLNVLEGCRRTGCQHLLFASSSSVYGSNKKLPFSERDNVDHPISLYAASKKANESMAHAYSHLFSLPATGFRFFTVYGPWGRPDMAMFIFAKAIVESRPIKLFNNGQMSRDFTYVDDVVEAIVRLVDRPPLPKQQTQSDNPDPSSSAAPWKIYNIGNNKPEQLMTVVSLLEKEFGRTAAKEFLPMQPGDVPATYADIDDLMRDVGFQPSTKIEEGIRRFANWYREYHRL
jgi:UDP-glucuronate 4-epimerase